MTHASLFSGIGGFDLAAEWMGWQNLFWCEKDKFCQQVLKYHFPNSIGYGDIKETNFKEWRGKIDVLAGSPPCQSFSTAGKRKGAEDERYLFPEMVRAVREIQPTWFIAENVIGLLSMVQSGSESTVESEESLFKEDNKETILEQEYLIESICEDFEREGYTVQPITIPACAVGAVHKRDRVWIVGYSDSERSKESDVSEKPNEKNLFNRAYPPERRGWSEFPAQPAVCRGNDGLPFNVDNLTIPVTRWEYESIKAYGNAIVPQVAYEIFKAIENNGKDILRD